MFQIINTMKRKIRSLQECRSELGETQDRIAQIITKSLDHWKSVQAFSYNEMGLVNFKPRTKACFVHDVISTKILEEFSQDSEIRIGEFNGVFGFLYKDLFFIRFKKLDSKSFKGSNVSTRQTKKYHSQNSEIEGLNDRPTILYAGYTLDKTGIDLLGIYFVCRDGDSIEWVDQIGTTYDFEQVSFDFDSVKQDEKQIENVVKARVKAIKANKKKGTGTHNN